MAVAVAVAGCSADADDSEAGLGGESDNTQLTGGEADQEPEPEPVERSGIDGDFGEVAVTITAADGETCELCLLLADRSELRSQGLMGVTDPALGGYDGMLFDHGGESSGAYWMKNTPMPLSIAYWDADGSFVSSVDMDPCPEHEASCPTYPAEAPFRFALEVTRGGLEDVLAVEGSTLTVGGSACTVGPP